MGVEVTALTWIVAVAGFPITSVLLSGQLVAVFSPRGEWTIKNVYGGTPASTDPKAYFAFNQGYAWADSAFWLPLQVAGSVGVLLGERWRFLFVRLVA
jgi:hypothetical protein